MEKILHNLVEARALVQQLKAEHRSLGIHQLPEDSREAALEADKALEAKRVEAREALKSARDELRKELNRRISYADDLHTLDAIRMLARRESLSESRIRAKERIISA